MSVKDQPKCDNFAFNCLVCVFMAIVCAHIIKTQLELNDLRERQRHYDLSSQTDEAETAGALQISPQH